jgi:hypothetical protein
VGVHIVVRMQDQDSVDPGDAALQELLASVAERADDLLKKERLVDYLITMPPLAEWSVEQREMLAQTCDYIHSLAQLSRELRATQRTRQATEDPGRGC